MQRFFYRYGCEPIVKELRSPSASLTGERLSARMVSLLRTISRRPCVGGGGGWACGVSAAKQIILKR
jgi:hypothetical protein